jgi:hypothetical protein
MLLGTGESGLQKPSIAQSWRATVNSQKAVVDRHRVALLDPERFFLSSHR